jgi:hypothetical protein
MVFVSWRMLWLEIQSWIKLDISNNAVTAAGLANITQILESKRWMQSFFVYDDAST